MPTTLWLLAGFVMTWLHFTSGKNFNLVEQEEAKRTEVHRRLDNLYAKRGYQSLKGFIFGHRSDKERHPNTNLTL